MKTIGKFIAEFKVYVEKLGSLDIYFGGKIGNAFVDLGLLNVADLVSLELQTCPGFGSFCYFVTVKVSFC